MMIGFAVVTNATSLNTSGTTHYTTIINGYDINNSYYFVQGSAQWQGTTGWPSNEGIFYAPFTMDYTQAGSFVFVSYIGQTTGVLNYYSGRGYKSNYRVGACTSVGTSVDTTFTYYV